MSHRTFRDRTGREWTVWAVKPDLAERRTSPASDIVLERRVKQVPRAPLPPELCRGWLAFESESERRRVAPIPPGWDELPDAALDELVEKAHARFRPRRLIE